MLIKTVKWAFFGLALLYCRVCFPFCFFVPPDNWELVQPKNPDPYLQIAFLGPAKSNLRPSINLSIEEIDTSLSEYIKAVRHLHESEMHVAWRDLGPFTFRSGTGRLAEITSPSPAGEVKMLQGIFVQAGRAYILTASAPKPEFQDLRSTLLSAVRSLTVAADLFSCCSDEPKKKLLEDAFHHLGQSKDLKDEWSHLQKLIETNFPEMGLYWRFLVLKDGYLRIFGGPSLQKPLPQ